MYLARELTDQSLPEIGRGFGGRDHSTVLSAVRSIATDVRRDPELAMTVDSLRAAPASRPVTAARDCKNPQPVPRPSWRAPSRSADADSRRLSTISTAPTSSSKTGLISLKLTVSRETFLAQLSVVARAASTRSAIQTLAGVLIRSRTAGPSSRRPTPTSASAPRSKPRSQPRARSWCPGRLLLDVARSLPKDSRLARVPLLAAGRRGDLRLGQVPPAHAAARGLPEAAGGRPTPARSPCRRRAFIETIVARRPLGLARRDAPAPHRRAGDRRRRRAADGRHRLLPALGQGDDARAGARRLAGGQRAGADAAGARAASPRPTGRSRST